MNNRKLIVKIAYVLDAGLIIILVGLTIYQQRLIRKMSDINKQMAQTAAISDSNTIIENNIAKGIMGNLAVEEQELRFQLEASDEELEMTRQDLANLKGVEKFQELAEEALQKLKRERENPTLMKMEKDMTEDYIVSDYGPLFEKLGLTDEEMQDLIALMVDFTMEMNLLDLSLDASFQEEDKIKISQKIENQKTGFKKQVSELIGAEKYMKYDAYKKRYQERVLITATFADLGLSDEKEQELINAMYEMRNMVDVEYGIDQEGIKNVTPIVDEMNYDIERYDSYIESGRRVLSGTQAEQFETRMNEMKEGIKIFQNVITQQKK